MATFNPKDEMHGENFKSTSDRHRSNQPSSKSGESQRELFNLLLMAPGLFFYIFIWADWRVAVAAFAYFFFLCWYFGGFRD